MTSAAQESQVHPSGSLFHQEGSSPMLWWPSAHLACDTRLLAE